MDTASLLQGPQCIHEQARNNSVLQLKSKINVQFKWTLKLLIERNQLFYNGILALCW